MIAASPPPTRVVQLVLGVDVGGLEFVVLNLVRHSDRARFEHRVVCLERTGALAPRFESLGVPLVLLGGGGGRLRAALRLARYLRSHPAELLHTHNPTPHAVGALARRLAGVPALLHTKHGRNYTRLRRAVLANRWASRWSDAVVAVSADAAEVARAIEHVPPGKLRLVYNGIEVGRCPERARGPGPPRAVCVARLHPVKDHRTLFQAVRQVLSRRPDFRLDVVGDGPERARLEALRGELGLQEAVSLHGHQDDVRPFLDAADVFVLASVSEGVSLTVLEAMAAALPAVVTDVGGNREVVVDQGTGLLVPAGSPESLASAILAVVNAPEHARRLGRAGRLRVEQCFDVRLMVRRYEELYSGLAQRGGGTR